jgi:hypothetical protein
MHRNEGKLLFGCEGDLRPVIGNVRPQVYWSTGTFKAIYFVFGVNAENLRQSMNKIVDDKKIL